MPQQKLKEKE